MSKYDKKTLEQDLKNSVTRKAEKAARVGLDFVARGGSIEEAKAKIKAACSVSDSAEDHVVQAATVIETEALDHFEVNLDEAKAEAVVYLEKVAAEEAAREEEARVEARVEAQAKEILAEIQSLACEIQWPHVYCDSMKSQNRVGKHIERLRKLGVCGRPWFDPNSDERSVFKLTSISNKYML